jgi:hypothetical protein
MGPPPGRPILDLDSRWRPVVAAFGSGFAGGFTGALLATGSLSAALTAGLISSVTAGLLGPVGTGVVNVIVGCVSGGRSSGNCGRLAAAEAFELGVQFAGVGGGGSTGVWGTTVSTVEAGVIGGIESKISGGGFNSGFSNAAGAYLGASIGGAIVNKANKADSHSDGYADQGRSPRDPADPSTYSNQEPAEVLNVSVANVRKHMHLQSPLHQLYRIRADRYATTHATLVPIRARHWSTLSHTTSAANAHACRSQ